QVIAISHQAQIASRADKHYLVYKETVDGETFSHIKLLNREENLLEIAKMISDGKASDASIRMAERLING
ncbi:MAG: DNA repair protein RecN, partial [Bacteroidales bacterium]|nr:DNA repair protein RecN [Bacteroidales bacterium]